MSKDKKDKKRYPASLFISGLFLSLLRLFWILIPAIVLLVIGLFVKICLFIGGGLIALALTLALIDQIRMIYFVRHGNMPGKWQDAIFSKDWKENVIALTEEKINESDKSEDDQ